VAVRSKTIRGVALAAVAVGCLLIVLWRRSLRGPGDGDATAVAERANANDRSEVRRSRPRPAPPPARRPTSTTFGRPNPIIARVLVDKTEVCRGEENFVHVDVDTVDGTDADLKIWLGGSTFLGGNPTGSRLPIRMFGPMNEDAPPLVMVAGWGGTHAEQPLPFVRLKDCDADPFLRIHVSRVDGEARDVYELSADIVGGGSGDVTWSFGDGSTAKVSEGETVQHSYGTRPKRSAYSEFLIAATITETTGRVLHGYTTLELVNREYWRARGGS
jgi:hypothetical protein